jgi:hypothetical protein
MAISENDEKNVAQSRARPRVPVDYPASFTADDASGHGTVTNLTLVGGEIKCDIQLLPGARLSLHVQPPSARPSIVIALAIVRWAEGDRCGLEFVRFEGDAKDQLKDMLNQ